MTTNVKLQYDEERLTLNDLEALTEAPKPADMKRVLGKFVVGADGEYLPADKGAELIGELNLKQLREVAEQFAKTAQNGVDPN